jgi:hypothetical protein
MVLNTFVLIYSILAIELMIRFNSITGVYDIKATGQIIPLVIGLATLWRTLIAIFTKFVVSKVDQTSRMPKGAKRDTSQYLRSHYI